MFRMLSLLYVCVLGAVVLGAAAGELNAPTGEGVPNATIAKAPEAISNVLGFDADETALTDVPPRNGTEGLVATDEVVQLLANETFGGTIDEGNITSEGRPTKVEVHRTELLAGNNTNNTELSLMEVVDRLLSNITVNETIVEPDNITTTEEPGDVEETIIDTPAGNVTDESVATDEVVIFQSNETVGETVDEHNGASENLTSIEVNKTEVLSGNVTDVTVTEVVEKLPSNTTAKETIVETKNISNAEEKPEYVEVAVKDLPIGNETEELGTTETVVKLPSNETIVETVTERNITSENGTTKVEVRRTEPSPDNKTQVTVMEVVEKLPSNETVKDTIVERKTLTVNNTDGEMPRMEKITEVESQKRICGTQTGDSEDNDQWQEQPGVQDAIDNIEQALRLLKELQEDPDESCQIIETAVLLQEKEVDSVSED